MYSILTSGLWAAFSVIVIAGLLNFRDGPFIRPHPAFWRVVLAFAVAYEMCLVFLMFMDKDSRLDLIIRCNFLINILGSTAFPLY